MGEKMDWSEAEAVVRAYRAEQGATADVDVATLARALGTDVGEVRRLAGRKPRFVDRSGVLSAGIALAVVAFGTLAAAPVFLDSHSARRANLIAPPPPAAPIVDPWGSLIITESNGKVLVLEGDGGSIRERGAAPLYLGEEDTKL